MATERVLAADLFVTSSQTVQMVLMKICVVSAGCFSASCCCVKALSAFE